jgi:hypothetical protein
MAFGPGRSTIIVAFASNTIVFAPEPRERVTEPLARLEPLRVERQRCFVVAARAGVVGVGEQDGGQIRVRECRPRIEPERPLVGGARGGAKAAVQFGQQPRPVEREVERERILLPARIETHQGVLAFGARLMRRQAVAASTMTMPAQAVNP